ncbi:hypothetical protein DSL92_08020 [Billgrantia gudaonensis]|uniref:Uncharacterized protein n=1 Tax=Billgrantia gudaonensis TaxID=376427 RepID=A0A432JH06_9GAMM|nr:hypothetical protein DSL92_08020 [Halomonas gudaonensis]
MRELANSGSVKHTLAGRVRRKVIHRELGGIAHPEHRLLLLAGLSLPNNGNGAIQGVPHDGPLAGTTAGKRTCG